jgi:hypothetical protein
MSGELANHAVKERPNVQVISPDVEIVEKQELYVAILTERGKSPKGECASDILSDY